MKKGQKMSQEQKDKISKSNLGKKRSLECRQNLSNSHKGKKPSNLELLIKMSKGRKFTDEHKEKIRQSNLGKEHIISDESRIKMRLCKLGKPSWNKGMKGYMSGEKNSKWIKDRSLVKTYPKRLGSLYFQWRKACLLRDKYTCQLLSDECHGKLEIHHILRWQEHPDLRYEVSNGITLCHKHHPRKREDEKRLENIFKEKISSSN